jgi:hypothetical protein
MDQNRLSNPHPNTSPKTEGEGVRAQNAETSGGED